MPIGDGSGPWGLGRKTGRKAGFCSGFCIPGYMNYAKRGLVYPQKSRYMHAICAACLIPGCTYLIYKWTQRNKFK